MNTVVDFHTHVLPGIDDGSASVEESIAMLRMEAEQGVGCVVATPHFYAQHQNLQHFLEERAESEQRLREEMSKHSGLPELVVGAEVHFFAGISDSNAIADLTIGSTKYILIEMPLPPWTEGMYRELEGIYSKRDLTPIIAHVDRYISRFRTFQIPQKLAQLPVLVQANASSFLENRSAAMVMRLLREEKIHLIGSDCHNLKLRKPNLAEAVRLIEKRLGNTAIERIGSYEKMVLQNVDISSVVSGA